MLGGLFAASGRGEGVGLAKRVAGCCTSAYGRSEGVMMASCLPKADVAVGMHVRRAVTVEGAYEVCRTWAGAFVWVPLLSPSVSWGAASFERNAHHGVSLWVILRLPSLFAMIS